MKAGAGGTRPGSCAASLTLQLAPALSEYLRQEAASRAIDPAELASRLLMRGLHAERLDEFASDLACREDACEVSEEADLAARIEAAALLAVLSAWRGAQGTTARTPCDPSPGGGVPALGSPSLSAMRELLERAGSARRSR